MGRCEFVHWLPVFESAGGHRTFLFEIDPTLTALPSPGAAVVFEFWFFDIFLQLQCSFFLFCCLFPEIFAIIMSTFRQFTEGYYSASFSPRSGTARLFTDLLDELERQITMKIFDANRTLTSLNSELRRTVVIDGVHSSVFQEALEPRVGGTARTVTALDDLTSIVPPHSLVRKHPRGDFCLVLPLMVAKKTIQPGPLADLSVAAATPDFQCRAAKGTFFPLLHGSV